MSNLIISYKIPPTSHIESRITKPKTRISNYYQSKVFEES